MSILDQIVQTKKEEIKTAKRQAPIEALTDRPIFNQSRPDFIQRLKETPYSIIAEFKRRSPSKQDINVKAQVSEVVPAYASAGAACVSVLTDTLYFGGSLQDLEEAFAYGIPLLRKDFILDEYQIYEAKAYGASAVLLIANILSKSQVANLASCAHHLGLSVLLEFYGGEDFDKYHQQIELVGINNRNLNTFQVDYQHAIKMRAALPEGVISVAESAIYSPDIYRELKDNGFDAFLMGEYFMKAQQPGEALAQFISEIK
ncbi:indole-3-glycerol phosphate synthase TrpC [Riemerella columbina]|uniref:indole-3-glycerol phosphate synthase TrpC n=1 Tax=Riemerella columbina TaxID=103810 RepID=UPI002670B5E2|nr:indole-3-glycerol phosphate synthase TrpC [Riemerella columbina]WKS94487.1 indole-3-glycerol phosphate synthase TrpC [Riemerella columbina]